MEIPDKMNWSNLLKKLCPKCSNPLKGSEREMFTCSIVDFDECDFQITGKRFAELRDKLEMEADDEDHSPERNQALLNDL